MPHYRWHFWFWPDNGGTIPSENRAFTTRVDPISPPLTSAFEAPVSLIPAILEMNRRKREMVEAPGTAPGSATLISNGVYRYSRLPDPLNIGL